MSADKKSELTEATDRARDLIAVAKASADRDRKREKEQDRRTRSRRLWTLGLLDRRERRPCPVYAEGHHRCECQKDSPL